MSAPASASSSNSEGYDRDRCGAGGIGGGRRRGVFQEEEARARRRPRLNCAAQQAPPPAPAAAPEPAPPPPPPPDTTLNNDSVLEMVKEKVPSDLILNQIRTADKTNFDLSTPEVIRLDHGRRVAAVHLTGADSHAPAAASASAAEGEHAAERQAEFTTGPDCRGHAATGSRCRHRLRCRLRPTPPLR